MGFRQPFTLHTDPANPGIVGVGEYCNDATTDRADRGFAGVCEWNLLNKPGNHGWPFCAGDNSPANTATRWNYATATTTGEKYDCSLDAGPVGHQLRARGPDAEPGDVPGPPPDPQARPGDDLEEVPDRHRGSVARGGLR